MFFHSYLNPGGRNENIHNLLADVKQLNCLCVLNTNFNYETYFQEICIKIHFQPGLKALSFSNFQVH